MPDDAIMAPADPADLVRVFVGQLPYFVTDMQLAWLCYTFGGGHQVINAERITKRQACGERLPTGCVHAACSARAADEIPELMTGHLLVDDTGVWCATTAEERAELGSYVAAMKQDKALRAPHRPYDTVVVQLARSVYRPNKPTALNAPPRTPTAPAYGDGSSVLPKRRRSPNKASAPATPSPVLQSPPMQVAQNQKQQQQQQQYQHPYQQQQQQHIQHSQWQQPQYQQYQQQQTQQVNNQPLMNQHYQPQPQYHQQMMMQSMQSLQPHQLAQPMQQPPPPPPQPQMAGLNVLQQQMLQRQQQQYDQQQRTEQRNQLLAQQQQQHAMQSLLQQQMAQLQSAQLQTQQQLEAPPSSPSFRRPQLDQSSDAASHPSSAPLSNVSQQQM
jgi:hypothetical protein